jgi:hypothetical protein
LTVPGHLLALKAGILAGQQVGFNHRNALEKKKCIAVQYLTFAPFQYIYHLLVVYITNVNCGRVITQYFAKFQENFSK